MKTENRNKRVVFTMGGKGGVGKTGLIVAFDSHFSGPACQTPQKRLVSLVPK